MNKKVALAVFLVVAGLLVGAEGFAEPPTKSIYNQRCATCHGVKGDGKGPAGAALNPRPAPFTDKSKMNGRSDDFLKAVIREGGTAKGLSATMPGFKGALTDAQIDALVAYIRKFADK